MKTKLLLFVLLAGCANVNQDDALKQDPDRAIAAEKKEGFFSFKFFKKEKDVEYKTYETLIREAQEADLSPSAKRLRLTLVKNCLGCHIPTDSLEENYLNKVGDFTKAGVVEKYSGAGNINNSLLFTKVLHNQMPPMKIDEKSKNEILDAISQWISDGSPNLEIPKDFRKISYASVITKIERDLSMQRDPENVRYISLVNAANDPKKFVLLPKMRESIFKLLNSLSWAEQIVVPTPIDADKLIYRIRLNEYKWSSDTWKKIETRYPYALEYFIGDPASLISMESIVKKSGSKLPILRADWMAANLSIPPLYHDILGLPTKDYELESMLGINVSNNIANGKIIRSAFKLSRVSKHNRMIERHDTKFKNGYYWKSYDFSGSLGRKNVIENPMGPSTVFADSFEHDGGEIIFNLPNGMQAYLLINNKGTRIDLGPTNIVLDSEQPDGAVINGLSCMRCHSDGMILKNDQVSEQSNLELQKSNNISYLKQVYNNSALSAAFQKDLKTFAAAQSKIGITPDEPMRIANNLYVDFLQADSVLNEFGLTKEEAEKIEQIANSDRQNARVNKLANFLKSFANGAKRDSFEHQFNEMKKYLINDFYRLNTNLSEFPVFSGAGAIVAPTAAPVCFRKNTLPYFTIGESAYLDKDDTVRVESRSANNRYTVRYRNGEKTVIPAVALYKLSGCVVGELRVGQAVSYGGRKGVVVGILPMSFHGEVNYAIRFNDSSKIETSDNFTFRNLAGR